MKYYFSIEEPVRESISFVLLLPRRHVILIFSLFDISLLTVCDPVVVYVISKGGGEKEYGVVAHILHFQRDADDGDDEE